jgi:hypothetical protein
MRCPGHMFFVRATGTRGSEAPVSGQLPVAACRHSDLNPLGQISLGALLRGLRRHVAKGHDVAVRALEVADVHEPEILGRSQFRTTGGQARLGHAVDLLAGVGEKKLSTCAVVAGSATCLSVKVAKNSRFGTMK